MIAKLSRYQIGVCLTIGAVGLLVLGVVPLLYGSYVGEGHITPARLGSLTAAEILAIALGSVVGVSMLSRLATPIVAIIGISLLVVTNWVSAADYGITALFLARIVAGCGGGLLVSLAAVAIARGKAVNAAAGSFMAIQAISQWGILKWSELSSDAPTSLGVQHELAVASMLAIALILFMPSLRPSQNISPLKEPTAKPSGQGLIALGASSLFVGSSIGIWAYLGVWMQSEGIGETEIAPLLSASLVGQLAGALVAAAIGSRGNNRHKIIALQASLLCITGLLLTLGPTGNQGWILITAFGFVWMMAAPTFAGYILDSDPTRASLPYGAPAQLLGAAILPTLAGEVFAGISMNAVMLFLIGGIVLSLAIVARRQHLPLAVAR